MALEIFSDAAALNEVKANEVFTCNGVATTFNLIALTGEDVGNVYLEDSTSYLDITFTAGVSSALTSAAYTINALVGFRVYHNGVFRGTVVSNTANTVTIDNAAYTAGAFECSLSFYTKQTLTTHYSVVANDVIFITPPLVTQLVHIVPSETLNTNFGGNPGDTKSPVSSIWLKRTPGFTYDTLKVHVEDLSADAVASTSADITFNAGVGSGFVGLVADALVGLALDHKGVFVGIITANTSTTVTVVEAYTDAVAGDVLIYSVAPVKCSLDGITYKHAVHPPAIATDAATRVYIKDTRKIPNAAMNYPNFTIRVSGIEYLE